MERVPFNYYQPAAKPAIGSKVMITLFALSTITLLIFAGSRDWNSDKSITEILTDTTDIHNLPEKLVEAVVDKAKAQQTNSQPELQTSLINQGHLQRSNSVETLPPGMTAATAH